MSRGVYLYVDGESHYAMAEKCWKAIHGQQADLNSLVLPPGYSYAPRMSHHQPAKFFWDKALPELAIARQQVPDRMVYFTSFTGSNEGLQEARVAIRQAGFEPEVVLEEKDLSKQRENRLKRDGLLIKAKGVDIGLAVRMLEDAYHGNYDGCLLSTSDIDYLPVIKTVRRMGKQVTVIGYGEAIAKDSPFLYLPEKFFDVGKEFMQSRYALKSP